MTVPLWVLNSAFLVLISGRLALAQWVIYSHWQQRWRWESSCVGNRNCRVCFCFPSTSEHWADGEDCLFQLLYRCKENFLSISSGSPIPQSIFQERNRNVFHWLQGQPLATFEWARISQQGLFMGKSHRIPVEPAGGSYKGSHHAVQDAHNNSWAEATGRCKAFSVFSDSNQ